MATKPLLPASFDPASASQQQQIELRQALAMQRIKDSMQQPQGQMVSGHYVAPSWTQSLAGALQGFVAQKELNSIASEQQDIQARQQQQLAQMFGIQPQISDQSGAQAFPVGDQAQQPTQTLSNALTLPGRSPQESLMIAQMIGLPEYMKELAKQGAPTTEQRNLAHLPVDQRNQLLEAQYLNEAAKDGMQTIRGQDGRLYAVPVAGYAENQARTAGMQTGAQEAARAQYDTMQVYNPQTGDMEYRSRANVLGAQPGQGGAIAEPNKTRQEAVQKYNSMAPVITNMLNTIQEIERHPGLASSVGMGSYLPAVRGTSRADFNVKAEQLQGQVFLQAYESLKGGGAITDFEGQKAEKAMAALSTAQSEQAYRAALNELKSVLNDALKRQAQAAGMSPQNINQAQQFGSGDFSSLWGG